MDFKFFIITTFCLLLNGCGGGSDQQKNTPPTLTKNTPPTLTLPSELVVNELTNVSIDVSASDPDGTIVSVKWEQISGESVVINNSDSLKLSFTAPKVLTFEVEKLLSFKVTAVDDLSASAVATINVKVSPVNTLPIADAGEDQTFLPDETVSLSCNGSHDPDGSLVNVSWKQTAGEQVSLVEEDTCTPSFKLTSEPSELTFKLTVEDEDKITASDLVIITTKKYSGEWNSFNKESLIYHHKYTEHDAYYLSASFEKGIAFISDTHRLRALDISDPFNIEFTGWVSSADTHQVSAIFGDLLIAEGTSTLWLYDIEDTASITLLSSIENNTRNNKYAIHNNIIYMAAGESGVKALNIANLSSPSYIDSSNINNHISIASDLKVKGDYLYVATKSEGLKVFNISSPLEATLIGEITYDHGFKQIEIEGNTAALASSEQHLLLVDISIPSEPSIISNTKTSASITNITMDDNIIAVSTFLDGIHFLEISEPSSPKWQGKLPSILATKSKILHQDTLLFLDYFSSILHSYDLSSLSMPVVQTFGVVDDFNINALAADNNNLYLSSTENSLATIDTTHYEQPKKLSEIITTTANKVAVNEDLLLLGTQAEGLNIIDISDKSAPVPIANVPTSEHITAIASQHNKVYINDSASTVRLLDVSEPKNPIHTSTISDLGWYITDIFLSQNSVFIASDDVLDIAKENEEGMLNKVGNYLVSTGGDDSWEYSSVVVYKNYAYLLTRYYGLKILDISDPENILEVKHLINVSGTQLKLVNDELYVIEVENGVSKYSLKLPEHPRLLSSYLTNDYVTDITIQGDQIFNMEWARDSSVYYYNYSLPKHEYSVFDFDKSLRVTENKAKATISSEVTYDATWNFNSKVKLSCIVSGGSCEIISDAAAKSAKVIWTMPANQGEYQISILIGNTSFFDSYEDMIIVE